MKRFLVLTAALAIVVLAVLGAVKLWVDNATYEFVVSDIVFDEMPEYDNYVIGGPDCPGCNAIIGDDAVECNGDVEVEAEEDNVYVVEEG